jgi:hypothetical protein
VEQHAVWNGVAGAHRRSHADQDDAEVSALRPWLRDAAAVAPAERVLGVDLSAGMLGRARRP